MPTSETLRSVIDAGRTSKRLDELSTARVIGKIAEQLHAAQHKAGAGKAIGPITPTSISIEAAGAATLGRTAPAAVTYMAPEQLDGEPGDRRSDVFSLGAIMWEALTHEPLFADAAAVKTQAIASPTELNANIPGELGAICMKALARKPADRYQSAKVMAAEIEAVLDDAGYADTDERIAEYMAELGKPQSLPKVTLITPPLGYTAPAEAARSAPVEAAATRADTVPTPGPAKKPFTDTLPSLGSPLPPILPAEPAEPATAAPRSPILPATVEPAMAALVATPTAAPPEPELAKPAQPTVLAPMPGLTEPMMPAPLPRRAESRAPLPGLTEPRPPPRSELPTAPSSSTVLGFASAASAAVVAPPPPEPSPAQSDPVLLTTPKAAVAPGDDPHRVTQLAPIAPPAAAAAPVAPVAPVKERSAPVPAVVVKERSAPVKKRDLTPHPASVVALPKSRDSQQEVLGGWGWGTDSHPALPEYGDEYDDGQQTSNRKTLLYMIGGGVAVAAVVTIIAMSFGGSTPEKHPTPQPAAVVQEGSAALAGSSVALAGSDSALAGSDSAPAGSDSAPAGSNVAMAGSAAVPGAGSDANSAVAAAVVPDAAVAAAAPDAAIVAAAPKPVPTKPAPTRPKPRHVEAAHHAEPVRVAHGEPHARPSGDYEAAYKQGLQQYMHGDAQGALLSLRTALAGNPSYPPTWRGLGLVFEKLNERDQARAAYRKYLQLAPNAGDADRIRNRLERLGP